MYITQLNLKDFKSHAENEIHFKNITLLTGLNGAGKSSIFQSLRMFWQYLKTNDMVLTEYGELQTLKNSNSKETYFSLLLYIENKQVFELLNNDLQCAIGARDAFEESVKQINFSYISANRQGPTEFQHIRNGIHENNVGIYGEYTLDVLSKFSDTLLPESFKDEINKQNTLENHVEKWLQEISPNIKLKKEIHKKMNVASFTINGYTPLNVGFGISYTLSIIVQLLYSVILLDQYKIKTVLLIENPEAHLHPKGQTKIAEFITKIANFGVQVIVETHSDYILDGLRIAVKDKIIDKDKTQLYYFELDNDLNTIVLSPTIGEDGHLNEWPENFFDTSLENKMRLM